MLTASCHCGAVRLEVPRRPRGLTNCNCSICRRYCALWAYYAVAEVRVIAGRGAADACAWGDRMLKFVDCKTCSCITHQRRRRATADDRMGINARNFEAAAISKTRIRLLDGASTRKYLD